MRRASWKKAFGEFQLTETIRWMAESGDEDAGYQLEKLEEKPGEQIKGHPRDMRWPKPRRKQKGANSTRRGRKGQTDHEHM